MQQLLLALPALKNGGNTPIPSVIYHLFLLIYASWSLKSSPGLQKNGRKPTFYSEDCPGTPGARPVPKPAWRKRQKT